MPDMPTTDAALETHLADTKDARLESYKDVPPDPEHLDVARAR